MPARAPDLAFSFISIVHALTRIFTCAHVLRVNTTFAVLAEPNRYRIVELLRAGPRGVSQIGVTLHLNQPQVSQHLKLLKAAGFVDVEPRAQERVYSLRPGPLREIHDWLERYRRVWDERFEALDGIIEELKEEEKRRANRKKRK